MAVCVSSYRRPQGRVLLLAGGRLALGGASSPPCIRPGPPSRRVRIIRLGAGLFTYPVHKITRFLEIPGLPYYLVIIITRFLYKSDIYVHPIFC